MNIGIDCRMYGIHNRGIGRYTERLILELAKLKDENRYTLFMDSKTAQEVELDAGKFRIIKTDVPWYSLKEHFVMPKLIKESRVDIMHWTHLNVSYWCPVPYIVTIHDLIVMHFPDSRATTLPDWKYKIKLWGYNKVLRNAVKNAQKIITVSEYTKRDIVKNLNVEESKIQVTYLGVDKMILGTQNLRNTPQFEKYLFDKFNIHKNYLLYVGSAYPHKNLESLVDVFQILRKKYNRNWQLVLVGRIDEFYKRLQEYVKINISEDLKEDIVFTGEVNNKDLDGIYRQAKLFVFPSKYEGFGLPPLEAMSHGVPVAASKQTSIPEVLGDAAYYFDPNNKENMSQAIDVLGSIHKIQDEFIEKGLARANQFSWNKTAVDTLDVYKKILKQ
jgi:glycosyltransferase involved in cell wall biosynthesis